MSEDAPFTLQLGRKRESHTGRNILIGVIIAFVAGIAVYISLLKLGILSSSTPATSVGGIGNIGKFSQVASNDNYIFVLDNTNNLYYAQRSSPTAITSWTQLKFPTTTSFTSIALGPGNQVYGIGTDNNIYMFVAGQFQLSQVPGVSGKTFSQLSVGNGNYIFGITADNNSYAQILS